MFLPILTFAAAVSLCNGNFTIPQQFRSIVNVNQKGRTIRVVSKQPLSVNVTGMVMKTGNGVSRFVVDKGVFSEWRFLGSKGKDTLIFGTEGTVISKKRGGVIKFGNDNVRDKFIFKNKIDVARCSAKHGFQCHPLNHLQKVTIQQFGKEDLVILQGKKYTYADLRGNSFPGVPVERLKIVPLK